MKGIVNFVSRIAASLLVYQFCKALLLQKFLVLTDRQCCITCEWCEFKCHKGSEQLVLVCIGR
jgi:NAD-dependent dihydropyrimidine dehydrogenase PreA subunit